MSFAKSKETNKQTNKRNWDLNIIGRNELLNVKDKSVGGLNSWKNKSRNNERDVERKRGDELNKKERSRNTEERQGIWKMLKPEER
jgi:hypothetical protein